MRKKFSWSTISLLRWRTWRWRPSHVFASLSRLQKRQKHKRNPFSFLRSGQIQIWTKSKRSRGNWSKLLSTTMRFRMNRYAWIADIKKAFLNISLHPTDAEAIRFLWSTEQSKMSSPFNALKWKRVPFGLNSSPFLLRETVNKHLKSVRSRFPGTVDQLMEQLYVDD